MKTTYSAQIFDRCFLCAVIGCSNDLQALGRFNVQRFAPVRRSWHHRKACDPKMAGAGDCIRCYPGTQTLGQAVAVSPAGTLMGNVADSKQSAHVNDDITLRPDKEYGAADFLNALKVTKDYPQAAQNTFGSKSALKGRVGKSEGYTILHHRFKRIEQGNRRVEFIGPFRRARVRCMEKADQLFLLLAGTHNLAPMQTLGYSRPQTA